MLKEMQADTAAVREVVDESKEKVDKATEEVQAAVVEMREGEAKTRDEMREIREEVNNIRDMLPKVCNFICLQAVRTLTKSHHVDDRKEQGEPDTFSWRTSARAQVTQSSIAQPRAELPKHTSISTTGPRSKTFDTLMAAYGDESACFRERPGDARTC